MRLLLRLFAIALLSASVAGAQQTPTRVALVVSNSAYVAGGVLTNPSRDARIVAQALRQAGFQIVDAKSDLNLLAFQRALRDFQARADGAEVALIYYAGHGIEGAGKNWLVPVDATLRTERDLEYEAIDLDRALAAVDGADLRIVILDACRNSPFGRSWRAGTRAISRGLSGLEADDVLVIFAAAPGQTASDGAGANSPFATALARRLPQAGLPIQLLGGVVRDDVLAATNGEQRPFVSASITGTPFYLVPQTISATPVTPTADPASIELAVWNGALQAGSLEAFQEYQRQYPNGRFKALSDQNIARLKPAPAPSLALPQLPASTVAAPQPERVAATQTNVTPPARRPPIVTPMPVAGRAFRDCAQCPEMLVIPGGKFLMGKPPEQRASTSAQPQHDVTVPAFAAGLYKVTVGEWKAFVSATARADNTGCYKVTGRLGSWRDPGRPQTDRHPVVCVSWRDAQDYVQWLSEQTGRPYRLLTEAEWEYAARAGAPGYVAFDYYPRVDEVSAEPQNAFGFFGMGSAINEWVEDCTTLSYTNAPTDGSAVQCVEDWKTLRGLRGSMDVAWRGGDHPYNRSIRTGFRVATSVER